MLPSLENLVLDTDHGVKRSGSVAELELEPAKQGRAGYSVQTDLLPKLLLKKQSTKEPEVTLEFVYAPGGEIVAKFDLTFSFDGDSLKGFSLGQRGAKEEEKKPCVKCTVRDDAVELGSLFHDLDDADREGCRFAFVEATETTDGLLFVDSSDEDRQKRLQSSINRKKGEGAILLGAVVEVAAGLGKKRIELTDAAQFHDLATAPYAFNSNPLPFRFSSEDPTWNCFGVDRYFPLGVTDFLRMTRGFGQYSFLPIRTRFSSETGIPRVELFW
jgi:hypothetical protein